MVPVLGDLTGLWRRSLISWPDGRRDMTTAVYWLQSSSFYADLRQPAGRPSFADVTCLRQVRREQIPWLVRQEGFAGELLADGEFFEWQRHIDFQPQSVYSDVGRLWFEGAMLVEEGRDVAYIEHWRRAILAESPSAAVRLRDRHSGCIAFIVRVEGTFMYVRARPSLLPPFRSLTEYALGAHTLQDAQDLIDCEISVGTVDAAGWLIVNSSLPFKEGRRLCPDSLGQADDGIATADIDPDGGDLTRCWDITDIRGSIGDLLALPTAHSRTADGKR